ncbi:MAG TPA: DUF5667 domain-containing protein [Jatrophihabitantaceae bacterium]|nr:DUF5667 domain-containing protein [Jatrophihabitantaceae bacterium]
MSEHRVSVLGASLRRFEDPERSSDPRIRAIVAQLRALEPAPLPRAHFRAELRTQLVAVAPRLVAEGVGVERPVERTPERTKTASASTSIRGARVPVLARVGTVAISRPLAIVASVVAVLALFLGGAVLASRNAVPGDTLYGLKRADESIQLAFTSGDTARGKKYLQFAANRAHEVSVLVSRASALAASGATAGGSLNAHTTDLIAKALDSADSDLRSASRLLNDAAVQSKSTAPLTVMTKWAPTQVQRLQAIASKVPTGSPLQTRTIASTQLVNAALARSQTLQSMLSCNCLGGAPSDSLGPVPCVVCTPTGTVAPSTSPLLPTTGSGVVTAPNGVPNSSASGSSTGTGVQLPVGGTSQSTTQPVPLPSLDVPPIVVPSLPIPTPTHSPTCVINLIGICVQI